MSDEQKTATGAVVSVPAARQEKAQDEDDPSRVVAMGNSPDSLTASQASGLLGALRGLLNMEGVRECAERSVFASILTVADAALEWGRDIPTATFDEAMAAFQGRAVHAPAEPRPQDDDREDYDDVIMERDAYALGLTKIAAAFKVPSEDRGVFEIAADLIALAAPAETPPRPEVEILIDEMLAIEDRATADDRVPEEIAVEISSFAHRLEALRAVGVPAGEKEKP